jgi:SAM-dependent methyltransferase
MERYPDGQAQVFGEDPALYERFRPGYPRQLMEAVVVDTGEGPVLEIGAGTGKATRALLALGRRVHALEPDARMAALLQLHCGSGLTQVDHATLEHAHLPTEYFPLIVAAQSWHWVDRETAYDLAADALQPNGRLALIWHHPLERQGLLGEAISQLYDKLAPDMPGVWPGLKARDFDPAAEPFAATRRFRTWSRREHIWHRRLDAPGLVGWLCSSSDHRLLPIEQRTELMAAVAALVNEFGGQVVVNMKTVAHVAHRV